jgi:hypothetical protein
MIVIHCSSKLLLGVSIAFTICEWNLYFSKLMLLNVGDESNCANSPWKPNPRELVGLVHMHGETKQAQRDQIFNKPQVHNMMTSMMISFDYNSQDFTRIGLDLI